MLTFPLRYNFPPLIMRITSWIVKKKPVYAENVVRKKVELQATFFVRLVRSLINLWFSTNQIEETNKQIKIKMAGSRPQSHSDAISMENSLELSTNVVRSYQQQQLQQLGQLVR